MNAIRTQVNVHLKIYIICHLKDVKKKKKNTLTYTLMVFGNKNLSKYEVKLYKHSKKTTNYKF